MACRVRYLNSAGIHRREIPGIDGLAAAFPSNWLLYASLQCTPKGSTPIEIDAMVVMDDRVLLLEIKDWNGPLTANGDQWVVNGKTRGRSPVDSVNMKAKKIASFLRQTIPGFRGVYVDSRVILTGSSAKSALSVEEQRYTLHLQEACSLSDNKSRARLLDRKTIAAKRPWQFEADFERLTRNARLFQPLEKLWNGYRIVDEGFVEHPRGLWREHRAELARDPKSKALVRIWSFDRLPPGLNSPEHRRFIAEREARAIAHLDDAGSTLIPTGVLLPLHQDKDEILTQHDEFRRLPQGWTTLDRFLATVEDGISPEDKTLIVATLLNSIAELHANDITHRDLGERNIWIKAPTSQALTGFMACQIPGDESLGDWLETIRYNARGDATLSGVQKDVNAVGLLALRILNGHVDEDIGRAITDVPAHFSSLVEWLKNALLPEDATRFKSGIDAAAAFGAALDAGETHVIDQTLLDRFETIEIPYSRWPIMETIQQSSTKHIYRSTDPSSGRPLIVKIWFGWSRGRTASSDLALMRLFGGVSRIREAGRTDFPAFVSAGLSGVGAFVAYNEADGVPWDHHQQTSISSMLALGLSLVRTVEALHALGCSHGDISGRNILINEDRTEVVLIDLFDFSGVGDGVVRANGLRPHNSELLNDFELDRYAVVKLLSDVMAGCTAPAERSFSDFLAEELDRDRIELLQPVLLRIQLLTREIAAAGRKTISIFVPGTPAGPLEPTASMLFARAFEGVDGSVEYIVSGLERELSIIAKAGSVQTARVNPTTFKSLSNASEFGIEVDFNVYLEDQPGSSLQHLLDYLRPLVPIVPNVRMPSAARRSDDVPASKVAGSDKLDVNRYWRRLLELEEEYQPTVQIGREINRSGDIATYAYERVGADFDFDPDEQVDVRLISGSRVGELDVNQTDARALVIKHLNRRTLVRGDRVVLAERRARSSLDRRSKAVERILNDEAAIKGLIEYFDPIKELGTVDYGTIVSDADLNSYALNDGQTISFRHVARFGPVALQQGPPGTGKTRFIAAFVHWLVTKQGAQRVLIASQSHEAVNNAIEALVDLYKKTGGPRPSLLRIGSKGITEKIRPFHTQALRERYQTRFSVAVKSRVTGMGSALGLKKDFVQDAFELEQALGEHIRRLAALALADSHERAEYSNEERRRHDRSLAFAETAFRTAVSKILGDEYVGIDADDALDVAFSRLAARHVGISGADIRRVRQIIELARDWTSSLASSHRNFEEFLAKTRTIVTATCVGVGQTKIRVDAGHFDWVIIDEAARCTASELAVPVQVGQRVLLVGDHLQLKPMIDRSVLNALAKDMPSVSPAALERSDFERAFTSSFGQANGVTLTEQYRMAPTICELVSHIFYEPHAVQLSTSEKRVPDVSFDSLAAPLDQPAVWIDTSDAADNLDRAPLWNPHSFWNSAEVDAIMKLLEGISRHETLVDALTRGTEDTPIGVICMYSAQKLMVEEAFAERSWDQRFRRLVRIDTVDSYQGKENSIVIVSLVRNNSELSRGHVASFNRCNVALSRAKERLLIVGSQKMWAATPPDEPMNRVLRYFEAGKQGTTIRKFGDVS